MTAPTFMTLVPKQPTTAEVYCSAWARMNEGSRFAFRANEIQYLKTMAMSMDDDLASLLLLKKMSLAETVDGTPGDTRAVGMNSRVEFRFGSGPRQFRQLLHPSVCQGPHAISIASRLGAGLVGLRSGQKLQWPDEDGDPRQLHVIAVSPAGPANDGEDPPPPLAG